MRHPVLHLFGFIAIFCCAAAAQANPALSVGTGSGAMGSNVRITVSTSNVTNLTNWGFSLNYDRAKFSYVSVTSGSATSTWPSISAAESSGKLWVGGLAGTTGRPVNGTNQRLCIITLHVNSGLGLTSSTTLMLTPGNPSGGLASASLNPGSITITAPATLALTVGNASGKVDGNVNVTVSAGSPNTVSDWGFDVAYDPQKLDFLSVTHNVSATDNWLSVTATDNGKLLHVGGLAGQSGTPFTGSSQAICVLTFHILTGNATTTNTTSSLTVSNPIGGIKSATLKSGVVTITAPATPAFTIGTTAGANGADVTVPVTASGVTSGTEFGFSVAFDAKRISLNGVNKGGATATWASVSGNMSGGQLWVGGLAGSTGKRFPSGTQTLCSLGFHILDGAASPTLTTVTLTPANFSGALKGITAIKNGGIGLNPFTTATLTVGTAAGGIDTDVVIPVTATNLTTGTAWGFGLDYDRTKLTFGNVWKGSATATWASVSGAESGGKLSLGGIAGVSGTPVAGNNKQLCRVVFHIKPTVDNTVSTSVTLTPTVPSGVLKGAVIKTGRVTINAKTIPSLTVGSATAVTNTKVMIPVTASGLSTTTAFGFTLDYDHSKLFLLDVTSGTATAKWASVAGAESGGYLRVGALAGTAAPIVGNNQQICRIYFRTRNESGVTTGSTAVTLTPAVPTGGLKGATLNTGKVTITGDIPLLLKIGTGSGNVGTTVTISATANGLTSSTAWGFDLAGDPARLTFGSIKKGTATSSWTTMTSKMVGNNLRIYGQSGSSVRTVSGMNKELVKINILVKSGATGTTVPLTPLYPILGLNSAALVSGQVNVNTVLSLSQAGGRVGTAVTLTATASGISTCTAWGFDLVYDTSKLGYISIAKGSSIAVWPTLTAAPAGDVLRITAATSGRRGIGGNNLELCKITFNIKDSAAVGEVLPVTPANTVNGLAGAGLVAGNVIVAGDAVGSVKISVTPAGAPWSLTDVFGKTVSGAGSTALGKVAAGPVTVTWQALPGFEAPPAATQTLAPGAAVAFTNVYKATATPLKTRRSLILRYLLGIDKNPAGLDLNYDGKIDTADLLLP